jgi:hypothetical protein
MFLLNNQPLSPDTAFTTADGTQYPANWLRLSSPEEREAIGITEVPDPAPYDQRFYWGYDADGCLIPKDHAQLVEQWTQQTRAAAGTLLSPTDWMVIREADSGVAVDPVIRAWREETRLACGDKVREIRETASTNALVTYLMDSDYHVWPEQPQPS